MVRKLRIGAVLYIVRLISDLHYVDAEGRKRGLNGHILHDTGEIKIEVGNCVDVQVVTLWHEALHGILTVAGHNDQPEGLIEPLAYGLVALIRDNPELITLTLKRNADEPPD